MVHNGFQPVIDHLVCLSHIYRTSVNLLVHASSQNETDQDGQWNQDYNETGSQNLSLHRNVFIPVHPPTSLYRFPEAYFAGHNHGRFIRFISQNIRQHSGGQKPLVFLILTYR